MWLTGYYQTVVNMYMCRPTKIVQLKQFIYRLKTVLKVDVQGVKRQPLLEGL